MLKRGGKYPITINIGSMDDFLRDIGYKLSAITFKLKLKK